MAAAISAMALRVGEGSFGQQCGKVGAFLDCAIPIVVVAAIAAGSVSIMFGLVH